LLGHEGSKSSQSRDFYFITMLLLGYQEQESCNNLYKMTRIMFNKNHSPQRKR